MAPTLEAVDALSVDELFSQYLIGEIRDVSHQYESKIAAALAELYDLVGSKYRDLIKIAEDIDGLYSAGCAIDGSLSELVYRPLPFVLFTDAPIAKFDTTRRQAAAAVARQDNQATVLRNVLNRLVKVDMLLAGGLRVSHTSQFVHHAKVLYTVELVFSECLQRPELWLRFAELKRRFHVLLEDRLARYNVLLPQQLALDRMKPGHFFDDSALVGGAEALFYDDDDFDDEEPEVLAAREATVLYPNTLVATMHSPAIVNYLVAYTIINPAIDVAKRFCELREQFAESVKGQIQHQSQVALFVPLLKYAENTLEYSRLFEGEYRRVLAAATKPWQARAFVGYKHWVSDEPVHFKLTGSSLEVDEGSLGRQVSSLLLELVAGLLDRLPVAVDDVAAAVRVYVRFVGDYCGLRDYFALVEVPLVLLSHFGDAALVQLTEQTQKAVEHGCGAYLGRYEEQAKTELATPKGPDTSLFSDDLLALVDTRVDDYVSAVNNAARGVFDGVTGTVETWTGDYLRVMAMLDPHAVDGILSDMVGAVDHHNRPGAQFTGEYVVRELDLVRDRVTKQFAQSLEAFAGAVAGYLTLGSLLATTYFYLGALKTLKTNLGAKELAQVTLRVDELINQAFDLVLASPEVTQAVEAYQAPETEASISMASVPTPQLTLLLHSLANIFSTGSLSSGPGEYGNLFTDTTTSPLFKPKKNAWLTGLAPKLVGTSPTTAWADWAYLHLLAGQDPKTLVEAFTLAYPALRSELDEATVMAVAKAVSQYHAALKTMYLPLLI